MSRPFQPSGIASRRHVPRRRVGAHLLRRRRCRSGSRSCPVASSSRQCSTWSSSTSESPTVRALRDEERERHRAADRATCRSARAARRSRRACRSPSRRRAPRRTAASARRATRPSTSTSRASSRPAADGITRGGPTIDACARCAAPNASSTYTSPSSAEVRRERRDRSPPRPDRTAGSRSS